MVLNLSTKICGKVFKNPLVLASGILGTEAELLARVAKSGAGAVTTKSCGLLPREGHENPTVLAWEDGLINAVGLTHPGVEQEVEEIKKLRRLLGETKIIASFFGGTVKEFVQAAKKLASAEPDFLELNISCPNTESEFGQPFGVSVKDTFTVTRAVKKSVRIPIIVKLSPNVTDIKLIAKAAEDGGADVISAINTLIGMVIDVESGKPILTNKRGGISGPAIRPIAVRCVYDVVSSVKVPVIGIGGVTSGYDAIQMMMAGAKAVGIGSAVYYRGLKVFKKINEEIKEFMKKHNYQSITDFCGISHED
ncbi:MAG TPA: dihydroorotate dehydrogenase [Nevskiaceae bacterium]|nr:dihydroorotate dehydrogenase [Nevskiaceae bacterium]